MQLVVKQLIDKLPAGNMSFGGKQKRKKQAAECNDGGEALRRQLL